MGIAAQLAGVLKDIHGEEFGGEEMGRFTITWGTLRELAGGMPVDEATLGEIASILAEDSYVVIPMSETILVAEEWEVEARKAPGRLINRYLLQLSEENSDFEENEEE